MKDESGGGMMNKTSYKPVPNVMNSGIAGAVAIIIIALLEQSGFTVDNVMAGAITLVTSFLAGYITSPGPVQAYTAGQYVEMVREKAGNEGK